MNKKRKISFLLTTAVAFSYAAELEIIPEPQNVCLLKISADNCYPSVRFDNTGKLISPKWKGIFTLPEDAWCLAECFYGNEKGGVILYEDKEGIKEVMYNKEQQKNNGLIITTVQNPDVLLRLYCIRTFGDLFCPMTLKKYAVGIVYDFSLCKFSKDAIFGKVIIPDDITHNHIFKYLDIGTLLITLPLVSKDFNSFFTKVQLTIKTPEDNKLAFEGLKPIFKNNELITQIREIYTQLIGDIIQNALQSAGSNPGLCLIPVSAFRDIRFSNEVYKKKFKCAIEDTLSTQALRVIEGNVVVMNERKAEPTDEERFDLLKQCLSVDQLKLAIEKIKKEKARNNSKYEAKKLQNYIEQYCVNMLDKKTGNWRINFEEAQNELVKVMASGDVLFEHIWGQAFQRLEELKDKRFGWVIPQIAEFYQRPAVLTVLLKTLARDLQNKAIDIDDSVVINFEDYLDPIIKQICNKKKEKKTNEERELLNYLYENNILKDEFLPYGYVKERDAYQSCYNEFVTAANALFKICFELKGDYTDMFKTYIENIQEKEITVENYCACIEELSKEGALKQCAIGLISLYSNYFSECNENNEYGIYIEDRKLEKYNIKMVDKDNRLLVLWVEKGTSKEMNKFAQKILKPFGYSIDYEDDQQLTSDNTDNSTASDNDSNDFEGNGQKVQSYTTIIWFKYPLRPISYELKKPKIDDLDSVPKTNDSLSKWEKCKQYLTVILQNRKVQVVAGSVAGLLVLGAAGCLKYFFAAGNSKNIFGVR